ncbi:MAG TPA: cyclic nucleotide-binding domain-containing protein [Acetobacteraceae bacterium]
MPSVESTVRQLPDFADLDRGLLKQIATASRIVECPPRSMLCRQGTQPDALRYLLDGQAALTQRTVDGSQVVIDLALPVSGLVVASVLAGSPYLMTAEALTAVAVLEIAAAPMRRLIETAPSLATAMLRRVSLDSQSATKQVLDLKLRTTAQRLGCYLLSLVRDPTDNQAEFRLPVQKGMIAGQLGCRFENLSRSFALLRDLGVETHGAQVKLHDIASLEAYAVPSERTGAESRPIGTASAAEAFSRAFKL